MSRWKNCSRRAWAETPAPLRLAATWFPSPAASLRPGRIARSQICISLRQQPRENAGPFSLPAVVGDEVLADFDQRVRQAAALAVHRDGVVGRVADEIWLVIADDEIGHLAQEREQAMGQAHIAIVKERNMPRARDAFEHGRKAVQGDQRRGLAAKPAAFELGLDAGVIGSKNLVGARFLLRFAQADIAGDWRQFADFRDRRRRPGGRLQSITSRE